MTEMIGRPHAIRLRKDLAEIREELIQTVQTFTTEDLEWAPKPGMKTVRQQLQEIGAMETLTLHMAATGEELDWMEAWNAVTGSDGSALLASLETVRAKTLDYLDSVSEAHLQTPIGLSTEWQGYFHAPEVEPEELICWIVRHEYYHLGQLVTYQMQHGEIAAPAFA